MILIARLSWHCVELGWVPYEPPEVPFSVPVNGNDDDAPAEIDPNVCWSVN